MMKPGLHSLDDERGVALVYLALVMIVMMGFAGLAIDGSHAYLERRRMQTAADAAALAGARELALGRNPGTVVASYVAQNDASLVSWSLINNGTGVRVQTRVDVATWFARAVGVATIPVAATSDAGFLPVLSAGGLMPFAVCKADVDVGSGRTYLWDDDQWGSGGFGWLSWNGQNSSTGYLEENIRNPENSGVWQIGDDITSQTGNRCNTVEDELAAWVGKRVTIPLFGTSGSCPTAGSGHNLTYKVTGFGVFVLQGATCKKADCPGGTTGKCVWGEFVSDVAPGEVYGGSANDTGLRDVRLLQ